MHIDLNTTPDLHARLALIVYTDDARQNGVVMQHPLTAKQGRAQLGAGHPVTRSTVETLLNLNARPTLTVIPPHVVAVGLDSLAWIQPRATRSLLFQGVRDPAVVALDGQPFPQPALLFIARGTQLLVYALRGDTCPDGDTPLYLAPYFNVFDSNQVCTGSMQLPRRFTPNDTGEWGEAFFRSNFTHLSGTRRRWVSGMTYRELWDAARAAGRFEDDWLLPAGMTLSQAVGGAA